MWPILVVLLITVGLLVVGGLLVMLEGRQTDLRRERLYLAERLTARRIDALTDQAISEMLATVRQHQPGQL